MLVDFGLSLAGRRALVTGGDSGIGYAIAAALLAAGARVAINGVSDPYAAAKALHPDAIGIGGDVGVRADRDRLIAAIGESLGGVDVLVLNAAVEVREPWRAISDDAIDRQVAVNLIANVKLVQAFAPAMAEAGWGRILAISSVQNVKPHPNLLIYAALKSALDNMMKNLARQLAPRGVTCNSLAPGAIETKRNAAVLADPAYRAAALTRIPAGAFGKPGDCAATALLLCSDAGQYITGAVVPVDGGMNL